MSNPELKLAYQFVQFTNRNIFLTGKAGTGKTTFLHSLRNKLDKRMIITAPTGVAAINAGGVTLHSFFQLPFGPIITSAVAGQKINNPNFKQKYNKRKINIIRTLELLIIDEISMVRADMLDAIDEILRKYQNKNLPFGGVQLLMIGDVQQLPPVVTREDRDLIYRYYPSAYFFHSVALREAKLVTIELQHVYRQSDKVFIDILNEVRDNRLSRASYDKLHSRYIPNFETLENDGYINLTTHNKTADNINTEKLQQLESKEKIFEASIFGNFPEHIYPTDYYLKLKIGAQVMFIKNDTEYNKRYYNGKIGTIKEFRGDVVLVQCKDEDTPIETTLEIWENIQYSIDNETKAIKENFIGSFTQYPLRLAWAVTIHKSQGLTFEKAIIDAADAFAHGQTYVALSRCKTLEGMVLSSKISESSIICDKEVVLFNTENRKNPPNEDTLNQSKYLYQKELLEELFNFQELDYQYKKLNEILKQEVNSYSGNIDEIVLEIIKNFVPQILKVANTFVLQIKQLLAQNPNAEENKTLNERLQKASDYFLKFIEKNIETNINKASFETDNQATDANVSQSLDNIDKILYVKIKCLEEIGKGFKTKTYLQKRAIAILAKNKKSLKKKQLQPIETKFPELYMRLKSWRYETAEINDREVYRVLPNKSLAEIANRLPLTTKQILDINGIGRKKSDLYSESIIEIVKDFCEERNIIPEFQFSEISIKKEEKAKKAKEPSNKSISLNLFKEGKSIKEIADYHGFVESTIEKHLAHYVGTGELDIKEFIADEVKVKQLVNFFKENPTLGLSAVKAKFGEAVSWGELHFIKKYLEFLQSQI